MTDIKQKPKFNDVLYFLFIDDIIRIITLPADQNYPSCSTLILV